MPGDTLDDAARFVNLLRHGLVAQAQVILRETKPRARGLVNLRVLR